MRRKFLYCGVALFCYLSITSCCSKKAIDSKDFVWYSNCLKVNRFEILDSVMVDSIIRRSSYEYEKAIGSKASCFYISQAGIEKTCVVSPSSLYYMKFPDDIISDIYGFSSFNNSVLLIYKGAIPTKLFKATDEEMYVLLAGGSADLTICEFDSLFNFIRFERLVK